MKYIENIHFSKPVSEYLEERLKQNLNHVLTVIEIANLSVDLKQRLRKVILDEFNSYHRDACYVCERIQEQISGEANKSTKPN